MSSGTYISVVAHTFLILWVLIGFRPQIDQVPIDSTDVTVVTSQQLENLIVDSSVQSPAEVIAPPTPIEDAAEQPSSSAPDVEPNDRPQVADTQPVAPQPEPEEPPDLAELIVIPQAEVTDTPPDTPISPPAVPAPVVEDTTTPAPRPGSRVAPTPVAPRDPDTQVTEVPQEAVEQAQTEAEVLEEQQETQPEEATVDIVTEAETPATRLDAFRPSRRPANVAQQAPQDPQPDAVTTALENLLSNQDDTPRTGGPASVPMTGAEKEVLRVAVGRCWNLGSLSTDALRTIVTLEFEVAQNRKPVNASIRLISAEGGSGDSVAQAFEAARRAILICGGRGFPLPPEKYEHWRRVEITFNPEQMGLR